MKSIITAAFAAVACSGAAIASPVYTTITDSSEPNQLAILSNIYAGATVTASGLNYEVDFGGGNAFTVTRIADSFDSGVGSTMLLGSPDLATMSDQIWQDGVVDIAGQARFAGFTQAFGTDTDITNGTVDGTWALDINNTGYNVTGQTQLSLGSGEFAWVRGNQGPGDAFGGNLQSSQNSVSGPTDRMISYLIQDADYNGGRPSYLLFIEDNGAGPDNDYNDLVIEISVVPVPAAAVMGLLGLAGASVARRRFRSA
jgi:opacity protein-like surface antigen